MDYLEFQELYHHGIKGQKWGVRRYQNEDGTLTEKGKKRYYNNPNKLQKDLYKEVKKMRVAKTGPGTQWRWDNTIGENSERALKKDWDEYIEKVEPLIEKMHELDVKFDEGKITLEQYNSSYEPLSDKEREYVINSSYVSISGKKYSDEAMKHMGNINIGYIKDIGFNEQTAIKMNQIIAKSEKKNIYAPSLF